MEKYPEYLNTFLADFDELTRKPEIFLSSDDSITDIVKINMKNTYDFSKLEEIMATSGALPELLIKNVDNEQIWQEVDLQNDYILEKSLKNISVLLTGKNNVLFSNLQLVSDNEEVNSIEENNSNCPEIYYEGESSLKEDQENERHSHESTEDEPDSGNSDDSESEGSIIDLFYKDFFEETMRVVKRNEFLEEQTNSTLELRQERLKKMIDKIEEAAISNKAWPLKGEILAKNRPVNSLLEEVLEFDLTSRPAPIMTEKTTLQLEQIIQQRIKDKVFDSVVRKAKPVETALEYKKKLVLDQEKSKQSLAQIYEKEYLEKQAALDPNAADREKEEPELHKEVKKMMQDLFNKLDALSNFHFTPKSSVPELRIVSNLPAISMEEVAPVATSDAALLAPEEISKKRKRDIFGALERSQKCHKPHKQRKSR